MTKINLGGGTLTLAALELLIDTLNQHGQVEIMNCSGKTSLMELGANLYRMAHNTRGVNNPRFRFPDHEGDLP